MKKYIEAQLQVVRINKSDIIATSTLGVNDNAVYGVHGDAPDRFRDFEDYSY